MGRGPAKGGCRRHRRSQPDRARQGKANFDGSADHRAQPAAHPHPPGNRPLPSLTSAALPRRRAPPERAFFARPESSASKSEPSSSSSSPSLSPPSASEAGSSSSGCSSSARGGGCGAHMRHAGHAGTPLSHVPQAGTAHVAQQGVQQGFRGDANKSRGCAHGLHASGGPAAQPTSLSSSPSSSFLAFCSSKPSASQGGATIRSAPPLAVWHTHLPCSPPQYAAFRARSWGPGQAPSPTACQPPAAQPARSGTEAKARNAP